MSPTSPAPAVAPSRAARAAWTRAGAVLLAAVVMMWAAFVNGQPFFTPDTQAYVRGPDVAVVKLLGARFASPWARQEPPGAHLAAAAPASPTRAPVHSPTHSYDDKEVLAGRSIYYGALAYVGQLTGGFWLTVFVQGLAVAGLAEMTLRAAGQRSLGVYGGVMALLAFATPAPFFVADLMPDIWSGVAIGAMALLFAFPHRLTRPDLAGIAAATVFAAMAHNSHVLIIAGAMAAGLWLWLARSALRLPDADPRPALAVGALSLACAIAGTWLFSAMVTRSAGAPPITPPFLTARVVADGPGRLYVREHCKDHPFAVCAFSDRLAGTDTDGFLWDEDPRTGVFAIASPAQRRALATEQGRFALASTLAHPGMQTQASARNVALQLVQTDLDDFDYRPGVLADLRADLPPRHRARLETSLAARRGWPIDALWAGQAAVIWLSLGMIGWGLALFPAYPGRSRGSGAASSDPRSGAEDDRPVSQLGDVRRFALLAVAGVLANTLACGVLSDLYGRYQARCIWVLPLAGGLIALSLLGRRVVATGGWRPAPRLA